MWPAELPDLPGLLSAQQVRETVAGIARAQEPSGAVPWFTGGRTDPWDHVEAAMALLVGGRVAEAERAYDWLRVGQREDGSWPMRLTQGRVDDPALDSNMCAYVAVGVWHHWLVRSDEAFVRRLWPTVRRALDLVVDLQLPFGGVAWAEDAAGRVQDHALLAGSSSIHHALRCGLALSELVDQPQPDWEIAAGRLGHALREHEDLFAPKTRFSMDWYYPVLGGAVRGAAGRERLRHGWSRFVVPGLGVRCVDDHPWVTGAESAELVLALDAVGERDAAFTLLGDVGHLRTADGAYWTGYVYRDDAFWPRERSTWTAAAVVLAADALSQSTAGADIFRGCTLPQTFAEIMLECGCASAGASADGVAGVTGGSR